MMSDRATLRAAIRAASNPPPVRIEVEGFAAPLYVKVQTLATSDINRRLLAELKKDDGLDNGRALALIITDADGAYLYDVYNHEDISELAGLAPDHATAIFRGANKANRLTKEEVEGKA